MGFIKEWLDGLQAREFERNSFRPGEDEIKLRKMHGEWWIWSRDGRRWVRWEYASTLLPRHQAAEMRETFEEIVRDNPGIEEFRINIGPPV